MIYPPNCVVQTFNPSALTMEGLQCLSDQEQPASGAKIIVCPYCIVGAYSNSSSVIVGTFPNQNGPAYAETDLADALDFDLSSFSSTFGAPRSIAIGVTSTGPNRVALRFDNGFGMPIDIVAGGGGGGGGLGGYSVFDFLSSSLRFSLQLTSVNDPAQNPPASVSDAYGVFTVCVSNFKMNDSSGPGSDPIVSILSRFN